MQTQNKLEREERRAPEERHANCEKEKSNRMTKMDLIFFRLLGCEYSVLFDCWPQQEFMYKKR